MLKKVLLLACLGLNCAPLARASVLCHGPGLFDSEIIADPRINLVVEVFGCASLLDGGRTGRITVDIGGQQMEFEGPLHPDGVHEHVSPPAEGSGDLEKIVFEFLPDRKIAFSLDFQNDEGDSYGKIKRTVLDCTHLPD